MTLKLCSWPMCSWGEDLASHYEVIVRYPRGTMHNVDNQWYSIHPIHPCNTPNIQTRLQDSAHSE